MRPLDPPTSRPRRHAPAATSPARSIRTKPPPARSAGSPESRLIVLGVVLFGLTWLAMWPLAHAGVGDWSADRAAAFQRRSAWVMASASLLAYLGALRAIERDRRGGGRTWAS